MTIVGSEKMGVYNDIAENKIAIYDKGIDRMATLGEHMDFDNSNTFTFNHRSGDVVMPKTKWIEPLKKEIALFMDCIQNGTDCITNPAHAGKVVTKDVPDNAIVAGNPARIIKKKGKSQSS